ncbi:MAG: putative S-layer protein [Nanoarchaeota archaeon]|nr:putative S-layer protein [Nanoarchaeota archaeon]MBU1028340.1 putative S-layer protein [Nanoarchaeota archaeon]
MITKSIVLNSLSIFVLFLFIGIASATLTLTEVTVPSTAEHNTEITISFNLESDADYTNLDWSDTINPAKATWTSLPKITSINAGDNLSLTATLKINEHASGSINDAEIIVKDTNTTDTDSLTFSTITINDSPSLSITPLTISQGSNSGTMTITNKGNTVLTGISLVKSGSDFDISFNTNNFNLNAGASQNVIITITSDLSNLNFGSNFVTVTATSGTTTASERVNTIGSFCDNPNPGQLDITIDQINVKEGFGDDDSYWYLFDEIEIDTDVDIDGSWDIDKIKIEWELYTTDGKRIMKGDESNFNLDYNDDKTITITFKLNKNIDDFKGENAIFYVKATGKINDNDADEYDNENTCDWDSQEVEVITDDNFVILDDINIQESTISPGSELHLTADVWNVGDNDQDDVMVFISESSLGINKKITIGEVKEFDSEKLEATIKIPGDAKKGTYYIEFRVYDDDNLYETDEEEDSALFRFPIIIEGESVSTPDVGNVLVTAQLESGGQAGKELVVRATITNPSDVLAAYGLDVSGYSDWAELTDVNLKTLVLAPGDSGDALFTFIVNKGISGEQIFYIDVTSNNKLILSQPASVTIEKTGFAGITGGIIGGGNAYLWGIGLLNIILVIIIIIVAVRVAKR